MASDIPDKIGAYVIDEELGRGAMGAVFRAHHEYTQREVALKVIFEHVAAHDIGVERFRREVSVSSRVEDPGVVEIFDAGPYEDTFYYAMEMLEGQELGDVAPNLPLSERVRLMVDVCRSLGECHKAGIVHRDLKPENIFVVDEEHSLTKIFDFGISSMRDAPRATATGNVVGTPVFMSPEQAKDATNVSPAADVWSVGVILYELTSGRLPVDADSSTQVLMKVASADLDYLEYSDEYPDDLVDVINRCLAPEPEDRYEHAGLLYDALDDVLQNNDWPESGRRSSIPDAYNPEPLTMTHDSGMGSGIAPAEGLGQTISSSDDNSRNGPAPVQVNEDPDEPFEEPPADEFRSASTRRSVIWGLVICGLAGIALAGGFLFAWSDGSTDQTTASPAVTQADGATSRAIAAARQRLQAIAQARRAGSRAATRLQISVLRGPSMPDGAQEKKTIERLTRSMEDERPNATATDSTPTDGDAGEKTAARDNQPSGQQKPELAETDEKVTSQSGSGATDQPSDGARAASDSDPDKATGAPDNRTAESSSSPTKTPAFMPGSKDSPDAGRASTKTTSETTDKAENATDDSENKSPDQTTQELSSKDEATTDKASDSSKPSGKPKTDERPAADGDKQAGSGDSSNKDDSSDKDDTKKDADDEKKEPEFFSF